MKCQRCAAENPDDAQFCRKCGWRVDVRASPSGLSGLRPTVAASSFKTAGKLLRYLSIAVLAVIGMAGVASSLTNGTLGEMLLGGACLAGVYYLVKR